MNSNKKPCFLRGKVPETLEHQILECFINTGKTHRMVLERRLNKTGVYRGQHQILMFLSWNPGISQKELARIYNVSAATVAVSLKKLEKGGYIERMVNEEDNRYNRIRLTEKGMQAVETSKVFFKEVEDGMFAGFSREEKESLCRELERLRSNLEHMLQTAESEGQNL